MFHAFQFSYPEVIRQWEVGEAQDWAIEGMAQAAVKSYPEEAMKRSGLYGITNLKDVDRALTAESLRFEAYLAQDFWAYVGSERARSLAYLNNVLAIGGVNEKYYDLAFKTVLGQPFAESYWGWVKNQAIENRYDVGVGTGDLCALSDDALQSTRPEEFLASKGYWPYDTGSAFDRLPPLTGRVVEMKFGDKPTALVAIGYSQCLNLQGDAQEVCKITAQMKLRVKYYVEDESQCWVETSPGDAQSGQRLFTNISPEKRYFAVIANVTLDETQSYYLAIE